MLDPAACGELVEALALLIGELIALDFDLAVDEIDDACLAFAEAAGADALMACGYVGTGEGPAVFLGLGADGDGLAGGEAGDHEVDGLGAAVAAADLGGMIDDEGVPAGHLDVGAVALGGEAGEGDAFFTGHGGLRGVGPGLSHGARVGRGEAGGPAAARISGSAGRRGPGVVSRGGDQGSW